MIHVLRLALPNVFLITGEKAILVDTGGPSDAGRIVAFLEAHGVAPRDLSLILHTHGHWDHAGSTAQLKALTHAPVAIHRGDADLLRQGSNGLIKPTNLMGRLILRFVNRPYPPAEPDLVIDEEISLKGFGVAARIVFTPGHTAGSISIVTEENEVIVGDLLMGGFLGGWILPRRPGLHYFTDNFGQLRASIQKVLALKPRIIHTGHGGPLDPGEVEKVFSQG
jgi:hydroxyacylglutathione hydrolase